ncbi:dienelactone hydrolase family protein [Herbaspirillum sp. RTI4]|uniref:dienelactone hydrolase family protein n=1 Tax=Herbaspirillum sp. RTI4 TaxID=3048640 RepID=UPI002AB36070|nr:dienelactone hydrolase family protein [Herbaspirillum sp. RTI4]MDY7578077.1 dienelactone hydrolase family protein [Herbaspirillum sp. RTI4]MEA9980667.1 dienelactone hydrolase family protein [Herbaspirillum sp. RTI4]
MGSYISIKAADGRTFSAYLAVPASGKGPGIVLAQEIFGVNDFVREVADHYAEEGYVVLAPDLFWRQEPGVQLGYTPADLERAFALFTGCDQDLAVEDIDATLQVLRQLPQFEGKAGVLGYYLGGKLAYLAACRCDIDVAVAYYGVGIEENLNEANHIKGNLVLHFAALDHFSPAAVREKIVAGLQDKPNVRMYLYPDVDHAFARPVSEHYDKSSALMAHGRSIDAFRKAIGPHYNLSALWDKHCEYEFTTRNVDDTMATMVAEPYVNHIPTMTGGVGYKNLHHFYTNHFVHSNPPDTRLIPISRTEGASQIVDECLFCFTHTCEIDWMLPGIKPTGKYVEIPLIAIVNFRGDKLYHEHIYWDQASVLVQVGLLDENTLPVVGINTAKKLLDETLPSNTLMK